MGQGRDNHHTSSEAELRQGDSLCGSGSVTKLDVALEVTLDELCNFRMGKQSITEGLIRAVLAAYHYEKKPQNELANFFNVSQSTISNILNNYSLVESEDGFKIAYRPIRYKNNLK